MADRINRQFRAALLIAVVSVACGSASARFMRPTDAPVDRLLKNVAAYVKENPQDPAGYYTLGRVHYLAWSVRTGRIGTFENRRRDQPGALPYVAPDWMQESQISRLVHDHAKQLVLEEMGVEDVEDIDQTARQDFFKQVAAKRRELIERKWKPPSDLPQEKLDEHALLAVSNLTKSVAMDQDNALYHLTLASALDEGFEAADRRTAMPDGQTIEGKEPEDAAGNPTYYSDQWRRAALEHYVLAYKGAIDKDRQLTHQPVAGIRTMVSYNAAKGYIALRGKMADEAGDEKLAETMAADIAKIETLPRGAITPLIFSLQRAAPMADLLDKKRSVPFDLDGDGRIENWPWVKTDTAILVWQPDGQRAITSGRQLFGSVTWWIIWPDGYRALDALDDNRDGQLSGAELDGLSIWRDADGDGVSDRGEVMTVRRSGIVSLSTRSGSFAADGRSPMNHRGLRREDGAVLPTFDWITEPADDD